MVKKVIQNKPFLPPLELYQEKLSAVWESHWLSNSGPMEQQLTDALADYGVVNPLLVSSGHIALELTIDAFELEGEIITTPFTFASTTTAIVRRGLKPVFVDIDPTTWNIDASKVEALITDKTSAILAVHVFGVPCDVQALEAIAKKHNLKLIYDAAHCFGVKINGRDISRYGDASIFSLQATKLFHSIEGGIISIKDSSLCEKINQLKNFGLSPEGIPSAGCNGKMHELSAAMGLLNLSYVPTIIDTRNYMYQQYHKRLSNIAGITLQKGLDDTAVDTNGAYFPIVINKEIANISRDEVADKLSQAGIEARKYFFPLTSDGGFIKGPVSEIPVAESIAESILSLPMHYYLKEEDIEYVCDELLKIVGH